MARNISWVGTPYKKTNRGVAYYHAVSVDGEIYRVHDVIYLLNPDNPLHPYIAKIVDLFANPKDKSGVFFMKNRWYYRHTDVLEGHTIPSRPSMMTITANATGDGPAFNSVQNLLRKYEIFESSSKHLDVNDVESIDDKCRVISMPQFARLRKSESTTHAIIPKNTFVCSLRYDEGKGTFRRISRLQAPKAARHGNKRTPSGDQSSGNNGKKRKLRPGPDFKRPAVRVGAQYQADSLPMYRPDESGEQESEPGSDGAGGGHRPYATRINAMRRNNFCMEFSASQARENGVDIEKFLVVAKRVDNGRGLGEPFFLKCLHAEKYNVEKAISFVAKERDLLRIRPIAILPQDEKTKDHGLENDQSPTRGNRLSAPSTPSRLRIPENMRPPGTPGHFMTSDWAYEIVQRMGARLPPFRKRSFSAAVEDSPDRSSLNSPKHEIGYMDGNADECMICRSRGVLLCCDGGCGSSFHVHCLGYKSTPTDAEWLCLPCRQAVNDPIQEAEEGQDSEMEGKVSTPVVEFSTISNVNKMCGSPESKAPSPLPTPVKIQSISPSSFQHKTKKKTQTSLTNFFPLSPRPSPQR